LINFSNFSPITTIFCHPDACFTLNRFNHKSCNITTIRAQHYLFKSSRIIVWITLKPDIEDQTRHNILNVCLMRPRLIIFPKICLQQITLQLYFLGLTSHHMPNVEQASIHFHNPQRRNSLVTVCHNQTNLS
ncbi:hypothetical protein T06_16277, partial [Trichinella sp. T6]